MLDDVHCCEGCRSSDASFSPHGLVSSRPRWFLGIRWRGIGLPPSGSLDGGGFTHGLDAGSNQVVAGNARRGTDSARKELAKLLIQDQLRGQAHTQEVALWTTCLLPEHKTRPSQ